MNLFLLSVLLVGNVPGVDYEAVQWNLLGTRDGVETYQWKAPGSTYLAFKTRAIIDATPARVASVLLDNDRLKEWTARLKEVKTIRNEKPNQRISYFRYGPPIYLRLLVRDRDSVVRTQIAYNNEGDYVEIQYRSAPAEQMPAEYRHSKYVRANVIHGHTRLYSMQGGTKTSLEMVIHADPGGIMPARVINWFQRRALRTYVRKLAAQLEKRNIEPMLSIEQAFRGGSSPVAVFQLSKRGNDRTSH